ncbi:hypothetical protein J1N35_018710 [Gossypium stocksii]|uniref:NADP-dependent oxidoreductase domain-containing protein n=1 Tax=Gossypium stocksii TaxID=47602 RepID=A0A9D3VR69_9ROSI|nr:hypothetical protein J1N35_018710 [Gossypium stocksii]
MEHGFVSVTSSMLKKQSHFSSVVKTTESTFSTTPRFMPMVEPRRSWVRLLGNLGGNDRISWFLPRSFGGGPGPNDKGLSRKHIVEGTKASLKRLDMDYVDVLYCHRPDTQTPIEETVRLMNYVIDKGWAFYWGTSEWSAQQITEAWGVAERLDLVGPIVEQPEYNLLTRHKIIGVGTQHTE